MVYTAAMKLTTSQYQLIQPFLPRQRGKVSLSNRQVLNAILYVAEHGCKWRGLPPHFGNWHPIYTRMNRWAKRGVLDRVFVALQECQMIHVRVEAVSLDSTAVHVHSKKNRPQAIGKSRAGWTTTMHLVAADARTAVHCSLSPGHAGDAPEGRALLKQTKLAATSVTWIAPMRATKHASSCVMWTVFWWCHRKVIGESPGNTTGSDTNNGMKWNGFCAD
jgi:transposase